HIGASLLLREVGGEEAGAPPPVDLAAERRNGDFVRAQIAAGRVSACHDVSDGGLLVALAEMAMPKLVGATIEPPAAPDIFRYLCGEDQARYVLVTKEAGVVLAAAAAAGVPVLRLGTTGGDSLTVKGAGAISVKELRAANEAWLPAYMAAP